MSWKVMRIASRKWPAFFTLSPLGSRVVRGRPGHRRSQSPASAQGPIAIAGRQVPEEGIPAPRFKQILRRKFCAGESQDAKNAFHGS